MRETMLVLTLPLMFEIAHAAPTVEEPRVGKHHADGKHHLVMCGEKHTKECCGDSVCDAFTEDINNCLADCPGVVTTEQCGEEPHTDRGGKTLTFGVSHRAKSAQDCCDKCTAHSKGGGDKGCNSWTFCGYPVCWGLDTGWNHTFGECWLRHLESPATPTFGQRGAYQAEYRAKMLHTRSKCVEDRPGGMSEDWSCPPTHVAWTSGSLGVKPDLATKWQTGGGWGNMRIHRLDAQGVAIEDSCTRNGGQKCDPKVLGHAG